MPRVSVILPNYNYARYLRERVCSILNQTMSDFELLYMDDNSKDESNLVMRDFENDPRVSMTLYTQNSGKVYQRWNDGAAQATGDWLWFAGADDSADPRFLETMLALADKHPTAGIVHCRAMIINHLGRILSERLTTLPSPVDAHLDQDYFLPGYEEAVLLLNSCFLFTCSTLLFRRDAFKAVGGFDTRLALTADYDIYFFYFAKV